MPVSVTLNWIWGLPSVEIARADIVTVQSPEILIEVDRSVELNLDPKQFPPKALAARIGRF